MKVFYLRRYEDVHGNSGTGIVAEGIIFDNQLVAMTWLSDQPTVTIFGNIASVRKLHGHGGKTEVIIQGKHRDWEKCRDEVRQKKSTVKRKGK